RSEVRSQRSEVRSQRSEFRATDPCSLSSVSCPLSSVLYLLAYALVAAAVLLKGPIGLALPGVVVLAHLFATGELPWPWQVRRCGRLAHALGLWWGVPLV